MTTILAFFKGIVKMLEKGFPQEPMIIQSDPRKKLCFIVVLWRNEGERMTTQFDIEPKNSPEVAG